MPEIPEELMELICEYCKHPFDCSSPDELEDICNTCPIAAKISEINDSLQRGL